MANEEHLAKLLEGAEAWNAWRERNPEVRPDLTAADLRRADLRAADLVKADLRDADLTGGVLNGANFIGANLSGAGLGNTSLSGAYLSNANFFGATLRIANLSGASLVGSDLSGTDLFRADLSGANLREANVDEANLGDANLSYANLSDATLFRANLLMAFSAGANLSGASLLLTNLTGADLRQANLENAELGETVFANTDLTDAMGLDTCFHKMSSTVDHRTIQISGSLPSKFLRGCGLPDSLIDYLPSLLNQAIQHYSCFISYSSQDDNFAKRLHADLQDKGVRCWFAPEDLKIGDRLDQSIDLAIRVRDKLLLILSEASMASAWVTKEVRTALDEETKYDKTVLFPIRLDEAVFDTTEQWAHDLRRNRHIGDFTNWKNHDSYQKALERLLNDLKVEKS